MNKEYLVVLPIEKTAVGDVYPQGKPLPLHCTVMPWFRIDSEERLAGLRNKLMLLACGVQNSIELITERQEFFGPHANVPVHVLRRDERLNLLHTELLVFLAERKSLPRELKWIGAGYHPYVTDTSYSLASGSRYTSKHLILIERGEDANKTVKSRHTLGDIPF